MPTNRLKDIAGLETESAGGPKVVTFISGKGGVGKSVLAYNTGAVLASQGYRTLIIDLDYGFGNIHILGNAAPEMTLAEVLKSDEAFEPAQVTLGRNYHLIASPSAAGRIVDIENSRLRRFMEHLKILASGFDYVILDTASGHLDIIGRATAAADINLIVINPELTSIADGYGLLKFLLKAKPDFSAHIFLNNIEGESDYEYCRQKFTVLAGRFLGRVPFSAGYLFSDRHVTDSVSKQHPLVEIYPDSSAVRQLTSLCRILTANNLSGGQNETVRSEDNINSSTALADIKE